MSALPDTVPITLQRGAPGEESRTETYDVPYREGMSVLDAVVWIRTNVDSSIAFRYSCVNANACKECMVCSWASSHAHPLSVCRRGLGWPNPVWWG